LSYCYGIFVLSLPGTLVWQRRDIWGSHEHLGQYRNSGCQPVVSTGVGALWLCWSRTGHHHFKRFDRGNKRVGAVRALFVVVPAQRAGSIGAVIIRRRRPAHHGELLREPELCDQIKRQTLRQIDCTLSNWLVQNLLLFIGHEGGLGHFAPPCRINSSINVVRHCLEPA
jgi:hypothetical protein